MLRTINFNKGQLNVQTVQGCVNGLDMRSVVDLLLSLLMYHCLYYWGLAIKYFDMSFILLRGPHDLAFSFIWASCNPQKMGSKQNLSWFFFSYLSRRLEPKSLVTSIKYVRFEGGSCLVAVTILKQDSSTSWEIVNSC